MIFVIEGQPRTKKNTQQVAINKTTGKPFVTQNAKYKQYEKDVTAQILNMGIGGMNIDYPVNVQCKFYREGRQRCDLTNLLEAIDDIMVKAGVLKDDDHKILASHDGSCVLYDKEHPRTVVTITRKEHKDDADIH